MKKFFGYLGALLLVISLSHCDEAVKTSSLNSGRDTVRMDSVKPRSKVVKVNAFFMDPAIYQDFFNDLSQPDSVRADLFLQYLQSNTTKGMTLHAFAELAECATWCDSSKLHYARNNELYYTKPGEIFDDNKYFFAWHPFPKAFFTDSSGFPCGFSVEMEFYMSPVQRDSIRNEVKDGNTERRSYLRAQSILEELKGRPGVYGNVRLLRLGLNGRKRVVLETR